MGFFDSIAQSSIAQTVQKAASVVTQAQDYLADDNAPSLISIGAAAAGNLSPAQIAAGLTGSPSQPAVVPSSAPASAIANASPGTKVAIAGLSTTALAAIAAGVYFLVLKKKG